MFINFFLNLRNRNLLLNTVWVQKIGGFHQFFHSTYDWQPRNLAPPPFCLFSSFLPKIFEHDALFLLFLLFFSKAFNPSQYFLVIDYVYPGDLQYSSITPQLEYFDSSSFHYHNYTGLASAKEHAPHVSLLFSSSFQVIRCEEIISLDNSCLSHQHSQDSLAAELS